MGCYDIIRVTCPTCDATLNLQSKGGACEYHTYELSEAPVNVLSDIDRHAPHVCSECDSPFKVDIEVTATVSKDWRNEYTEEDL